LFLARCVLRFYEDEQPDPASPSSVPGSVHVESPVATEPMAHGLDSVEEITATEEVDHACRQTPRLEDVKQIFTPLQIALPDAQIEIQDLIAEGDKVVGRVTARRTHEGEFMGIAPTGKPLGFTAIRHRPHRRRPDR